MTVLATVISRPDPTRIVTDSGFKSLSTQNAHAAAEGHRQRRRRPDVCRARHDRAGRRRTPTSRSATRSSGSVGYTDATVVLHETMYGVRNGIVEVAWPIVGRGKLQ